MRGSRERAGGAAACALLLGALAGAQTSKPAKAPPAVDPYTRGEALALARAGYSSFGPMRFGPSTTDVVQQQLGDVPILWVETAHFRLGSSLDEYRAPRADERPSVQDDASERRAELAALAEVLERVPVKTKVLDAWLRLHLYAHRLERLYADFSQRLALGSRTRSGSTVPVPAMNDKLLILITQKKSTLARFTSEYCGAERGDSMLHHFADQRALFFGISDESIALGDAELYYAVVYGVTQNLACALGGYRHDLPTWWANGLALWFAREARPQVMLYARPASDLLPPDELADWQPLVRGRVAAETYLTWSDMLGRPSWLEQPFGDNLVLWSRIDFLLRREGLAGPLTAQMHLPVAQVPDSAKALHAATGMDLDALDRAWCEWVLDSYRKKRR
jgi:hypothetical protein